MIRRTRPRHVGNELAGTHQAAASARHTAQLRRAEADTTTDPDQRARLVTEAEQDGALADTLDQRVTELAMLDDARARWLAHTAGTRAAGERADAELAARHADRAPEPVVTAPEWLTAHRHAVADDEQHREITETDVDDRPAAAGDLDKRHEPADDEQVADGDADEVLHESAVDGPVDEEPAQDRPHEHEPAQDRPADDQPTNDALTDQPVDDRPEETEPTQTQPAQVSEPDLREVAAAEPAPVAEDDVRVPTADETAAAVERANRALAEIRARDDADAREAERHRADQLTAWHTSDQAAIEHDETADTNDVEDVETDAVDA